MFVPHLIGIRFFLGNPSREWCEARLKAFENIGLPCLRAQTCQDFVAILAVDYTAPPEYVHQLFALVSDDPNIIVQMTPRTRATSAPSAMFSQWATIYPDSDDVITTRCDNDDAIAVDFVEVAKTFYFEGNWPDRSFTNWQRGIYWQDREISRQNRCGKNWAHNFVSLRTKMADIAEFHALKNSNGSRAERNDILDYDTGLDRPMWFYIRWSESHSVKNHPHPLQMPMAKPHSETPLNRFPINMDFLDEMWTYRSGEADGDQAPPEPVESGCKSDPST